MRTLGTIWTARAKLYNSAGKVMGTCTDAPNAIAKAFMEHHQATSVIESYSNVAIQRTEYRTRMQPWNDCPSGFVRV